ncbi:winged helix-turn-helix transcriptional regulator [Candidatus Bipolaricaulota bacterium]|nr:winged helix-turn-helix transcriptional regulator [Candidatus Bipolaricaulota bacterium]
MSQIRLSERLKALANPIRLRALGLLLSVDEPVCVCELADALGIPEYKVSRHLSALKAAGFVAGEHRGPWVYYEPVPSDLLEALEPFLTPAPDDLVRLKDRMGKRQGGVCVIGPQGGR